MAYRAIDAPSNGVPNSYQDSVLVKVRCLEEFSVPFSHHHGSNRSVGSLHADSAYIIGWQPVLESSLAQLTAFAPSRERASSLAVGFTPDGHPEPIRVGELLATTITFGAPWLDVAFGRSWTSLMRLALSAAQAMSTTTPDALAEYIAALICCQCPGPRSTGACRA